MQGTILDPRVAAPAVDNKWAPILEGRIKNEQKRRWIAHNLEMQHKFMENARLNGTAGHHFYGDQGLLNGRTGLEESTLAANIDRMPVQTLAIVRDVYERFAIDELVSMRTMSGPQVYIQTIGFDASDAGKIDADNDNNPDNAAGWKFNAIMEPDYSDCPTECTASNGVDFDVAVSTLNAECKRLQGKFSVMAEQDASAQFSMNLGDEIRQFMGVQMAREIQAEVLALMISSAATSINWSSAIPANTAYENLDPKVYARTLYEKIQDADNGIFKHADGRRGANWIAGDPDSLNRLVKLDDFSMISRDALARGEAGEGDISQHSNLFGVANGRFKTYKFPFMQANTLLLGVKSEEADEVGFVHATYVPLSDLGTFRDPATACVTVGATTRYANKVLRPGLFAKVNIS